MADLVGDRGYCVRVKVCTMVTSLGLDDLLVLRFPELLDRLLLSMPLVPESWLP